MNIGKKIVTLALVLALLLSVPIAPEVFAAEASTAVIYDLMTNDMVDPVGIDDPTPTFSWKMKDSTLGQKQTAYRITVKTGSATVWDSGKVESDVSVGVVYGGEALRSSTTYTWSVQVWDKDGNVASSGTASFEMALMEADAFANTHFISYQEVPNLTPTTYTIDFDFEITSRRIGFLFSAEDESNFMLWQLDSRNGVFKPHVNTSALSGHTVNICQTAEDESFRILQGNGGNVAESDAVNAGYVYHARIAVADGVIQTYLGTSAEALVLIDTYNHGKPVHLNRLGVRQAGSESGYLDNLTVVDAENKPIYTNTFDSVDTNDIVGTKLTITEDGRLQMASSAGVCLQLTGDQITNYTIDFDFEIDYTAVALLFGATDTSNYMMWQFSARQGLLKPHACVAGSTKGLSANVNISQDATDPAFRILQGGGGTTSTKNDRDIDRGHIYHARIVVRGTTVETWLCEVKDGVDVETALVKISTYSHSAVIPLNKLGVRAGGSEWGYFDNLTVTDAQGAAVYSNTFDSAASNDITGADASIVDGRLYVKYSSSTIVYLQQDALEENKNSVPAYRKSITVKEGLVSAKLYTAGLGVYESYINGQRVGRKQADGSVQYDELKPGFTQRNLRQFYSSFDVTWMLAPGENVLGGVVTNGWWENREDGGLGRLYGGDETAYFAKLILTYSDGSQEVINTDTTWKSARFGAPTLGLDTSYGATRKATGIYAGERYDATVDQSWMKPGYNDSSWENVKLNTEFQGELCAWDGVPVIVREDLERTPVSIKLHEGVSGAVADVSYGDLVLVSEHQDGEEITVKAGQTLSVNFGQNFAGWEYLELKGPRGTVVTVEHGEALNEAGGNFSERHNDGPGGSIYQRTNRSATANTVYRMSGGAAGDGSEYECYHPTFSFYGFQYIEITATADITIRKIRGQVVSSAHNDTATMVTSDTAVNQLLSNARWGMLSNYLSVPTDCPQRDERHGWTGDAQVFSQAGTYLTFSKSFLNKYLQDLRDGQSMSWLDAETYGDGNGNFPFAGSYPDIAPMVTVYGNNTYGEVGWSDAGIIIPWNLYMMYGDTTILEDHWDSMVKYLDYLELNGGEGLKRGALDHLSPEKNSEMAVYLGDCFFAWDALMMVDMANALGKTAEAKHYQQVYEAQKKVFQERYVLSDGTLCWTEQTAFLFALYLDLLPNEESVAAVTDQLVTSLQSYGYTMQTGFLGTSIVTKTLTKIGRNDLAYTLLLTHQYPSWLYTVDQGATTMWERWDTYRKENGWYDPDVSTMNSMNHYAYGAVAGWMYQTLAGIGYDEETPGFKNIMLAPAFDSRLPSIESSYESVYGLVSTKTSITNGKTTFSATIPANTTATARIPVAEGQLLTVNGKALSALTLASDGIRYVETANGTAQFEAVAGSFVFELTDAAAEVENIDWSNYYCQACGKNVAWTAFTGDVSTTGHFYLADDLSVSAAMRLAAGVKLCFHLNGNTLSNTSTSARTFDIGGGRTLNVMDHANNAGTICKSAASNTSRSLAFDVWNSGKLNIYGGTFKGMATASATSVLYADKSGQINMYGGVITGGNSTGNGGNVLLKEGVKFTLHGGTIEGGTAAGNGGNIYVESVSSGNKNYGLNGGAAFTMNGGTVQSGTAANGGNIYATTTASDTVTVTPASVDIHGGTVLLGKATNHGGSIYMNAGSTLTIDEDKADTLIKLGNALKGGNIMLVGSTATMDAGTISYGKATATTSADGGGGNLLIDASSSFTLNQDAGKESIITDGRSDATSYGGNVRNHGTFTMNDGTVKRGYTTGQAANIMANSNNTYINGGTVGKTLRGNSLLATTSGKLHISGGTFYGGRVDGSDNYNVYVWDNATVNISGGTFLGGSSAAGGNLLSGKGAHITITGGSFTGCTGSDISIDLADSATQAGKLSISDATIGSMDVTDNHPTYDSTFSISGKTVIGKLTRGGATKPVIAFALTEGADVCFSGDSAGEIFGSGESVDYITIDDEQLYPVLDGTSLKWAQVTVTSDLKFTNASVVLRADLGMNFKLPNPFTEGGYTEPYAVFQLGDKETKVDAYSVDGDKAVFKFRNIAPHRMGETITATLYATKDGVQYSSEPVTYSVKQYCYAQLQVASSENLRTLLVDLLNYGSLSQQYVDNAITADNLVNCDLTDEQKAWASTGELTLQNITAQAALEGATVTWKAAGLYLEKSVDIRLKFQADSIEGLSVKFVTGGKTYEVTDFTPVSGTTDCYYVYLTRLNAGQMRQEVKATVYKDGAAVSNTLTYSIESYAAQQQNAASPLYLAELVKAMMYYGDSAAAYAE